MLEHKFYFINEDDNTEIEIENITFPLKYTDVMDGSFDTGSFECIMDIDDYSQYKNRQLNQGNFIRRKLLDNDIVLNNDIFIIDDFSVEKDSLYDGKEIKVTIKYVEATKYLTNLMIANHTYSISPVVYTNLQNMQYKNSLYDTFIKSYDMLGERNNIFNENTESYRKFTISQDLEYALKSYPNINITHTDVNFFDVCKSIFSNISSVPYYRASTRSLENISSMGVDKGKYLKYDEDKIVVSSSYSKDMENNAEVIENKAVNIYEDNEYAWYPSGAFLIENSDSARLNAAYYARPKGLNEGLEQYQYWYNWYIELPYNIERIEKVYSLDVNAFGGLDDDTEEPIIIRDNNEFKDVTNRIIEYNTYSRLTETEKKKYAYYKRGSNRIEGIVISTGITTVDDKWPWDKTKDNNVAFAKMFAIKYKPILDTDITVLKNGKKTINKKNIVLAEKNISDASLLAKTNYELNKNYYGQYMLEIAGEYQNLEASDIVSIEGFENYGISGRKYIIQKVDTTFEQEGCHQIIYFNEMVAKNNVLVNENNLVRISQNPSYESNINRVFKRTDAIGIKSELVDSIINEPFIEMNTYGERSFIYNCFRHIVSPPKIIMLVRSCEMRFTILDLNEKNLINLGSDNIYLSSVVSYLNSGTVSQAIIKANDNCIFDNRGIDTGIVDTQRVNPHQNYILKESKPIKYTDLIGQFENCTLRFNSLYGAGLPGSSKYSNSYPVSTEQYFNSITGNAILASTINFNKKDMREVMTAVYEQSWYGVDDNVQLTDYFTSCTSAFRQDYSNDEKYPGRKLSKRIRVFDKKVYNINSIKGEDVIKTIEFQNLSEDDSSVNLAITNNAGSATYIELSNAGEPFLGQVGQEIEEYSFVIDGVQRVIVPKTISEEDSDSTTGSQGYESINIYVPQMVITVPKHVVKEKEYIKLTLEAYKV